MGIGLGLATSHAPGMYFPLEDLPKLLEREIARAAGRGNILPSAATSMTKDMLIANWRRYRAGHAALKKQLEKYNPDVLILIGSDNTEQFGKDNRPSVLIYTGAEASGYNLAFLIGGKPLTEKDKLHFKCDPEFAKWLLNELQTKEGIDMAMSEEVKPMGKPNLVGLPHSITNPAEIWWPELPTVIVYENTYDGDTVLSASRCYDLGVSIARVLEKDKKRIALLGTGGLNHDAHGIRAMWVDEVMDRHVLEQISRGNARSLTNMWKIPTMTLVGGTAEIRAWITVAGAMEYLGAKATVVDYLVGPETNTGCAWAYWPTTDNKAPRSKRKQPHQN